MVRVVVVSVLALVALPLLLLPPLPGRAAEELRDNVYVVRPGDTLSGIAGRFLGDPKRWPEILDANPQVKKSELIFPGDALQLPLPEEDIEGIAISTGTEEAPSVSYEPLPVSPPEETAAVEEPPVPADLPVEIVRPVPVINDFTYMTAGYVTDELPRNSIVASIDSKISLVEGDEVIIEAAAGEGTTYTVVRPTRKVYHPRSGEYLGWVIQILGWAEVTCAGDSTSRAVLSSTIDPVHVGDLVIPFDPDDILEKNILGRKHTTFCLREGGEAYIVAAQKSFRTLGEGDVVFVDQGRSQGVAQGDQFVVYRTLPSGDIHVIGQVQVLKVGERTSTALVINSIREINVADHVLAWEPPGEDPSGG